jgi:predicted DNA-binding WGR domain protein
MPDELRSPIKHHLVLHRIDPEQGIRRFYSLMIAKDLFGTIRLVRNWGRIGTKGQKMVEIYDSEIALVEALEAVARAKRRRAIRVCEVAHPAQSASQKGSAPRKEGALGLRCLGRSCLTPVAILRNQEGTFHLRMSDYLSENCPAAAQLSTTPDDLMEPCQRSARTRCR